MLKILFIILLFSSCTKENKKFIIEELRNSCAACVTAFEEKQTQDCVEDSGDIYDDLLRTTNNSFDDLTIASKWEVVYNSSTEKAEIFLIDKETDPNGEKFLYFYVRPPSAGLGGSLGEIANPLGQRLVIKVSQSSNTRLNSRFKVLSCEVSDNGDEKISNKDNGSTLNYVLTTQRKVKQPGGTYLEDVYNFRIFENQPMFMFLFGFDYNQVPYNVDDEISSTTTKSTFSITKVASVDLSVIQGDANPPGTPTGTASIKSEINGARKCHFDRVTDGENIPFDYPPSDCGPASFFPLPNFPSS